MSTFLGNDTKFPIEGKFEAVDNVDLVNQDLQLLLITMPGERVNDPEYGCRLYQRQWENLDEIAEQGVSDIRNAITTFEPRVQLIRVDAEIERDRGLVTFSVTYNIIDQNTAQNLVFPFTGNVS